MQCKNSSKLYEEHNEDRWFIRGLFWFLYLWAFAGPGTIMTHIFRKCRIQLKKHISKGLLRIRISIIRVRITVTVWVKSKRNFPYLFSRENCADFLLRQCKMEKKKKWNFVNIKFQLLDAKHLYKSICPPHTYLLTHPFQVSYSQFLSLYITKKNVRKLFLK